MDRGVIYVYATDPYEYELGEHDIDKVYTTYKDTADAITRGDKEIHTTQMCFMSHMFIKAGWDIVLLDGEYEVVFDQESIIGYPEYYHHMLDMYRIGELYDKD